MTLRLFFGLLAFSFSFSTYAEFGTGENMGGTYCSAGGTFYVPTSTPTPVCLPAGCVAECREPGCIGIDGVMPVYTTGYPCNPHPNDLIADPEVEMTGRMIETFDFIVSSINPLDWTNQATKKLAFATKNNFVSLKKPIVDLTNKVDELYKDVEQADLPFFSSRLSSVESKTNALTDRVDFLRYDVDTSLMQIEKNTTDIFDNKALFDEQKTIVDEQLEKANFDLYGGKINDHTSQRGIVEQFGYLSDTVYDQLFDTIYYGSDERWGRQYAVMEMLDWGYKNSEDEWVDGLIYQVEEMTTDLNAKTEDIALVQSSLTDANSSLESTNQSLNSTNLALSALSEQVDALSDGTGTGTGDGTGDGTGFDGTWGEVKSFFTTQLNSISSAIFSSGESVVSSLASIQEGISGLETGSSAASGTYSCSPGSADCLVSLAPDGAGDIKTQLEQSFSDATMQENLLGGTVNDILDGDSLLGNGSSSPILDPLMALLPSFAYRTCTPLVFFGGLKIGSATIEGITISCQYINTIRDWAGYVLYLATLFLLITLFLRTDSK